MNQRKGILPMAIKGGGVFRDGKDQGPPVLGLVRRQGRRRHHQGQHEKARGYSSDAPGEAGKLSHCHASPPCYD